MTRLRGSLFAVLAAAMVFVASGLRSPAAAAAPVLDLGQYQGKVVVVDFWASWCVPCRRSFPWLNDMRAKYGEQGLVIIGVNVDAERADADKFLATIPARFGIVYDPKGELATLHRVSAMPTSLVFDRTGALVTRHLGFQNAKRDEYEATLRQALAAAGPSQPVARP